MPSWQLKLSLLTRIFYPTRAIVVGGLNSIIRLDIRIFQYNFSGQRTVPDVSGVLACLVVKSVAKIDTLSNNELRALVDQLYSWSCGEDKMVIYKELHQASKAVKDNAMDEA